MPENALTFAVSAMLSGCDRGMAGGGGVDLAPVELVPYVPPTGETPRFEVRDSAGVELIHNGRVGAWGPELATTVEELRIGVLYGEDEYELYGVRDVVLHPEGAVLVRQGNTLVRLYDPDGRFIRQFGRRGEGPGEFRVIERLWFEGDSLIVVDQSAVRMTVYGIDGEILSEIPIFSQAHGQIRARQAGPTGWLAQPVIRRPVEDPAAVPERLPEIPWGEPRQPPALQFYRWVPGSTVLGALVFEIPTSMEYGVGLAEPRRPLFSPAIAYTFGDEGQLYLTRPGEYRFDAFDADGRLTRTVTREFDPVPIGQEDVDEVGALSYQFEYRRALGRGERPSMARLYARGAAGSRTELRKLPLPPHQPPIGGRIGGLDRGITTDPDGWVWVERTDAVSPAHWQLSRSQLEFVPDRARWDVFAPDGRFQGTVETPRTFELKRVRGLAAWGVVRDELDVEYVVRLRVVPPGAAARNGASPAG